MSGVREKKKVTTLDKIRKYYLKGADFVKLSPKQDEIRIMTFKAWNLFINYHSTEQAIKVLMNDDVYPCGRATAYRYVNYAKSIFGNPEENNKEAEKYLIREDLMRLQQQAMKDKEYSLALDVLKQRIKLGAFDKQKDPRFDPDKLKAQTYIIKVHPAAQAAITEAKEGGFFNFNTMGAEEIDFEELGDEGFKREEEREDE